MLLGKKLKRSPKPPKNPRFASREKWGLTHCAEVILGGRLGWVGAPRPGQQRGGACEGARSRDCPRCCFHRCFELSDTEQSKAAVGGIESAPTRALMPTNPRRCLAPQRRPPRAGCPLCMHSLGQPRCLPQPRVSPPPQPSVAAVGRPPATARATPGAGAAGRPRTAVRAVMLQFDLAGFDLYLSLKPCVLRNIVTFTILPPTEEQAEAASGFTVCPAVIRKAQPMPACCAVSCHAVPCHAVPCRAVPLQGPGRGSQTCSRCL